MKKHLLANLALLAVLGASLVGGVLPVYVKIGLKVIPPFSFTLLRFILASLFFLPILTIKKQKISFGDFVSISVVSALSTINIILFSFGIRLTAASIGQMIYAGVPIVAAVFSYFILKEKITVKKTVGVFLGFLGTLFIVLLPLIGKASSFSGSFLGNLLIFAGMISYSFYGIYSKRLQKKYTPIQMTAVFSLLTALIVFFPALGETVSSHNWWLKIDRETVFAVFYVGLIGTAVYYLLYQYAIKHGSALIASMVLYLQPVATIAWAIVLLGEITSPGFLVAAALTLLGAYITTRPK
jgi:drug/metabolite transporter (DMT)-like permease